VSNLNDIWNINVLAITNHKIAVYLFALHDGILYNSHITIPIPAYVSHLLTAKYPRVYSKEDKNLISSPVRYQNIFTKLGVNRSSGYESNRLQFERPIRHI